jgi:hypothetical protein
LGCPNLSLSLSLSLSLFSLSSFSKFLPLHHGFGCCWMCFKELLQLDHGGLVMLWLPSVIRKKMRKGCFTLNSRCMGNVLLSRRKMKGISSQVCKLSGRYSFQASPCVRYITYYSIYL